MNLHPWQVWWTNFDPQVGREQAGRRPAVVVSTEYAVQHLSGLAIVVPCSTRDRGLPFQPRVDLGGQRSVALCDHVTSISSKRLLEPHPAELTTEEIDRLKFVLRKLVNV